MNRAAISAGAPPWRSGPLVVAGWKARAHAVVGVSVGSHQIEGVDHVLHERVAAGDIGTRAGAVLLPFANGPILAVGEVPEIDRVRRVEAGLGHRAWLEQPLAHDVRSLRVNGPDLVGH